MIVDQPAKKCSHNPCTCEVPAGKAYCSAACEQAATSSMPSDSECACGHASCSGVSDSEESPRRAGELPRQF